jgi:hypothetical protein
MFDGIPTDRPSSALAEYMEKDMSRVQAHLGVKFKLFKKVAMLGERIEELHKVNEV